MSSELTIDIQLTELGFSSWDFQNFPDPSEQKEAEKENQVQDSNSEKALTSTPSSPVSVESDEDEDVEDDDQCKAAEIAEASEKSWDALDGQQDAEEEKRTGVEECEDPNERQVGGHERKKLNEELEDDESAGAECVVTLEDDDEEEEDEEAEEDDEDEEEKYDLTDEEEDGGQLSAEGDDSEEHRCHVCDLSFFSSFLLREHMHLHTGVRPYCCSECGKQFCHLSNYRSHLRSHSQTSSVPCLICTATFTTQDDLKKHLDTNHLEDEFYQCDFCKRIFTCMNECKEHVDTHQQEEKRHACSMCERSFRKHRSLLRHLDWHKKAVLICTDCGQVFSSKTALLRHSFYHLGLLPYTCVRCKRHFRLPSHYHQHECKPGNIQCVACLVVFQSQGDFEEHKKNTGCWGHQTAAMPVKRSSGGGSNSSVRCMECGQTFDSTEELKKHASTHQRVMKCSECGMGFRSSIMLMSHMGGHAAQRPCLCQKCGLGFSHQQAYDSHLKTCGLVSPPEAYTKKQKPKASPAANKVPIAPKGNVKQPRTVFPKNEVSRLLPLHTIAPLVQVSRPQALSGQILDKEALQTGPLLMFLPVAPTPASEGAQTSQYILSSAGVSEKHLLTPHTINIPLAAISSPVIPQQALSAQPAVSVDNPGGNILIPLTTNGSSPKMRWTIVEDQQTSTLGTKTHPNEQNVVGAESKPIANTVEVSADNMKRKVFFTPGTWNRMQTNVSIIANATQTSTAAASVCSETPQPLCLVKEKNKGENEQRQQEDSNLEDAKSSQVIKRASPLITQTPNDNINISSNRQDILQIKMEPETQGTESVVPASSSLESFNTDIKASESSPEMVQNAPKKGVLRVVHIYPVSLSRRLSQSSPPSAPPSKKINLGTGL